MEYKYVSLSNPTFDQPSQPHWVRNDWCLIAAKARYISRYVCEYIKALKKKYSVDTGVWRVTFSCPLKSRHVWYTNKEASLPLLHFTAHVVQVYPSTLLEYNIYYTTWPEITWGTNFLLLVAFSYFSIPASFVLLHISCWALRKQVKASGIREGSSYESQPQTWEMF